MYWNKDTGFTEEPKTPGAAALSEAQYRALIEGQSAGKFIIADANGMPILQDPPAPTAEQIAAAVTAARATAYAKESDPLFFKYQRDEATKDEWLAKVAEIKARFPDGVMPY